MVNIIRTEISAILSFLVGAFTKSRHSASRFEDVFPFEYEVLRKGVDPLTFKFNNMELFKDA